MLRMIPRDDNRNVYIVIDLIAVLLHLLALGTVVVHRSRELNGWSAWLFQSSSKTQVTVCPAICTIATVRIALIYIIRHSELVKAGHSR